MTDEELATMQQDPTGKTSQDLWSRYWFDHVCDRLQIPEHDERIRLMIVYLEEQHRWLESRVVALEHRNLTWFRRLWAGWR